MTGGSSRRFLYWTPRILSILFAAFISIFALDVFEEAHGVRQTAVALGMHLIPTALVLAVLAIAWRWEWVGAVVYLGLAALYVVMFAGRFPLTVYLIIAGPLVVMAALFLVGWRRRAGRHAGQAGLRT